MAGRTRDGGVFKSASTGVLRPGGRGHDKSGGGEEVDPLLAVLNHSWEKKTAGGEDDHGGRKRLGIAGRSRTTGGEDKSSSSKAGKPDEGRSRLGQTGNALFVDTGAKRGFAPTFEEDSPAAPGDSPPVSPGDTGKARRGKQVNAAPTRRYRTEVCPDAESSPRLREPPLVRKGQIKLDFEKESEKADAEHAQAEIDDHRPHMEPEQEHFVDLVHHFQGAVNQAGVRLNEMLTIVREHFLQDENWLEDKMNYDQLTEISFEVQTANYFIAKWHHQLEPRKVGAPVRPTKIEDMSAEDILAQVFYSISRMEVLAAKFGPVLEKICHDAKTMRRGPNGEPLTPTSKQPLTLAKKRGFQDTDEFNKFMGHLEHILSVTQHLEHPPSSGLPEMKNAAVVMMAAAKFKKGLTKKLGDSSPAKGAGAAMAGAFKSLGASVDKKVEEGQDG